MYYATCRWTQNEAKSLTGFKLCATTHNNVQQDVQRDATCNIQQYVGSCWPTMLRPFAPSFIVDVQMANGCRAH